MWGFCAAQNSDDEPFFIAFPWVTLMNIDVHILSPDAVREGVKVAAFILWFIVGATII